MIAVTSQKSCISSIDLRPVSLNRRAFACGLAGIVGSASGFAPFGSASSMSTKIGPIGSVEHYSDALAIAAKRNAVALIDIAADWCEFCHTIESKILPDPRVAAALSNTSVVRIDVTEMTAANRSLLHLLQVEGPPTVFLVDPRTGRELPDTRSVGWFDVENLLRRLAPFSEPSPRRAPRKPPAGAARG